MKLLISGVKIDKISKIRNSHFEERSILRRLAFIESYFKIEHSSSLQRFAVFWPKMAKHDVNKSHFPKKILDGFFWNFGGRRQIDAGEGTESFASISAAVFELSRKSGRGGGNICPPAGRGLMRRRIDITKGWNSVVKNSYRAEILWWSR